MPRLIKESTTKKPPVAASNALYTTATATTTTTSIPSVQSAPLPSLIVALRNVFQLLDDEKFESEVGIERQRRAAANTNASAGSNAARRRNNATTSSSISSSAREKISTAAGLLVLSQSHPQKTRKRLPSYSSIAAAAATAEQNDDDDDDSNHHKKKQKQLAAAASTTTTSTSTVDSNTGSSSPRRRSPSLRRSLPTTIKQRGADATATTSSAAAAIASAGTANIPTTTTTTRTIARLPDPEQIKKLEALKKLHPNKKCVALEGPPYPPPSQFQVNVNNIVPNPSNVLNFPVKLNYDTLLPEGMSCCVMCGEAHPDWSSKSEKTRKKKNDDTAKAKVIIPAQNKGLCTICDVKVWTVVATGLEIKWCKGCKNFRPWRAAFGMEKPNATKCTRCRERSKLSYEMKKSEGFVVQNMQREEEKANNNDDDNEQQQHHQGQGRARGAAVSD